jgi:hypothetical protein
MFALGALVIAAAAAGQAQETRFSQKLAATDRTAMGLEKLSSDQLAVLDALIRRDEKMYAKPDAAHPSPARFSLRIFDDEYKSAGLDLLTEAELTHLDSLVEQYEAGGPPSVAAESAATALKTDVQGPAPEIHGMISFTYGAGRGGYREMGGSMLLNYDDPAHGISLLVGYGEMHASGPFFRRGCVPFDAFPPFVP